MKNLTIFARKFLLQLVRVVVIMQVGSYFQLAAFADSSVSNDVSENAEADNSPPKLTKQEVSAVEKVKSAKSRAHEIRNDNLFLKVVDEIKRKPDYSPDIGIDAPEIWVQCFVKNETNDNQWFSVSLYPNSYLVVIEKYLNDPKMHVLTITNMGRYKSPSLWRMLKEAVLNKVKSEKNK